MDAIRVLVDEAGAKLEVRDREGQTPLFVAADCGHQSAALYLIARGADAHVSLPGRLCCAMNAEGQDVRLGELIF